MSTLEKHLTPAELKEYRDAAYDVRHYQAKLRQAQAFVRTLKNRARKRRDTESKPK